MVTHVKVLGVLYLVFSALGLMGAFAVASVMGGAGLLTAASGSEGIGVALPVMALIGVWVAGFLIVLSVPGFIAGIGLLKFKPWARTLTIVLSAINLIHVPFGTILGAYGLWVMLSQDGAKLFAAPSSVQA